MQACSMARTRALDPRHRVASAVRAGGKVGGELGGCAVRSRLPICGKLLGARETYALRKAMLPARSTRW